ncbi:MAG: TIR domain-containing protein [Anaerolineales bacterium]|nr:TIR domain-containing protein [Anaerolineales bacterium]
MQKVFISYSRKDMDFVRKLAGDLEKAGYDVWWDITDLRGGDDWVRTLPAAIEASQFFIIVLTPNSTTSEWVQKEYTQALTLHKKIIPLMFEACDVPFSLNTINYTNFLIGEYADNFKNLLSALGHTGEEPVVTPFEKAKTFLPPAFRKFVIPIIVAIIFLAIAALLFSQKPVILPSTLTPTTAASTDTSTSTPPSTSTPTASVTVTPTLTPTLTATETRPSLTPSATKQPFETLTYCVNSLYANTINVRSGPGTNYAVLGEPLRLRQCLAFRAVNEIETWLLIAPNQEDPAHQQYEGGWIFRDLLGLGLSGPIDLPAVTLTFTPTPSDTPTPSNTPTITPSTTLTPTETPSPTETATDTPEPTNTPIPVP